MEWWYLSAGVLALVAWALCKASGEAQQKEGQIFKADRKEGEDHEV